MGFADGYVVALSLRTGQLIWSKKLRTRDRFYDVDMAPFVDEKSVIVGTFDGALYSLNRLSGESRWVLRVGGYGGILVEKDRIFMAGLNGNIYAIDKNLGHVIWKTPFKGGVGMTPARAGKYLVLTTSGDPVYVLDPETGKVLWTGNLGAGTLAGAIGNPDGWFCALSNFGNLFSFHIKVGKQQKWAFETIQGPSAFKRHFASPNSKTPGAS